MSDEADKQTRALARVIFQGVEAANVSSTRYVPSKQLAEKFYPLADFKDAVHRAQFAYGILYVE